MYCCLYRECSQAPLQKTEEGLRCRNGHFFPYIAGTNIPVFIDSASYSSEFTDSNAVQFNDNNVEWLFAAFRADERSIRRGLLSRLRLSAGQRVLVTAVGTGKDLPVLAELLGEDGVIFAQDISVPMTLACRERINGAYGLSGRHIELSVSDAVELPFCDNAFDAAYHFGGLNFYSDLRKGLAEMDRVVKSGGRVVLADKGVAPWLRHTDYGKMIITNNPLAASPIPLDVLPMTAKDVNLSWTLGYYAYVIDYTVSDSLPDIDLDRRHVGRRGGSLRTRYYGQLEGVDPHLKERLYAEAEKSGLSRVDFLERILRTALDA